MCGRPVLNEIFDLLYLHNSLQILVIIFFIKDFLLITQSTKSLILKSIEILSLSSRAHIYEFDRMSSVCSLSTDEKWNMNMNFICLNISIVICMIWRKWLVVRLMTYVLVVTLCCPCGERWKMFTVSSWSLVRCAVIDYSECCTESVQDVTFHLLFKVLQLVVLARLRTQPQVKTNLRNYCTQIKNPLFVVFI